jgi:hypothetical protein
MNLFSLLKRSLPHILAARRGSASGVLHKFIMQLLLKRGLARSPVGLVGMFVLRRALVGEGRLFGMDLASRRQARMAWLAGLLQNKTLRRRLSAR